MRIIKVNKPTQASVKKRVCAYARVSTMFEEQGQSFENQISSYERLIKSNPEYEFVKVYYDRGVSGCSENRQGLNEMLTDARAGKIDLIITKSISRFARNTVTILKYARELKDLGVGIFFEEYNILTTSTEGEIMLSALSAFAQEELRSMSENQKWSIHKKYECGDATIKYQNMYGYYVDEYGDFKINREQAEVVKRIYNLYLSGLSADKIAKQLNSENTPTHRNKKWLSTTILEMLKNEKYKGDFQLQKYYSPSPSIKKKNKGNVPSYYISENHAPIIAPDIWDKVQQTILDKREKRKIENTEKYSNRYPLSGMLLCPYCGSVLKRRHVHNNRIEWWCSKSMKEGVKACKGIHVRDEDANAQNITEQTVVEEEIVNGKKYYRYTCKSEYDKRNTEQQTAEIKSSSLLPSVNRQRRTVIKL